MKPVGKLSVRGALKSRRKMDRRGLTAPVAGSIARPGVDGDRFGMKTADCQSFGHCDAGLADFRTGARHYVDQPKTPSAEFRFAFDGSRVPVGKTNCTNRRPALPCPAPPSMIYDDEVFKMACDQFQVIADYLNIDKNDRDRLMYPKRAMAVTLPVHMDDGSTKTFQGYRVQHHLTLGPDQRRHAFRAESLDGRNRRARDVDELEMRAEQFALRRSERRRRLRPDEAFAQRARSRLAPLHAGDDPVRRPEDRHHGAGHGDERAGDGVVHGHLFGLPGLFA